MKNFGKEWTVQQDTLLKQLMDLGYSSKKIYENYGEIFGRTEKAISCRISYLNKPQREKIKDDAYEKDNDIIEKEQHISVDVKSESRKVKRYDEVDLQQFSLFDTVKDEDIINELKELDLANLTPIDALNTLYKLQNKLKNRW